MLGLCPQCSTARETNHRFCPKCGFPLGDIETSGADPLIGRALGGYVVLGLIGEGGMGKVYRAEQRALRRTVAIKIIHAHLLSNPEVAPRFLSEARATSQLNHPNVVSVIDFGKTEEGLPFIVMEHLRGRALDLVLQEEGVLAIRRVADIIRQVLAALGEAHALGIIHRDLKPANIVLDRMRNGRDFVKVLDFGLAKTLRGSSDQHRTAHGQVFGTPAYMSPEQASASPVDTRSDLFSVGMIFYELLAGKLPIDDENPTSVILRRISADLPPPSKVACRPLPASFVSLVVKATARAPELRFQSADEFASALDVADQEAAVDVDRATMPAPALGASCNECGTVVPERQKFCGSCGARVPTPAAGTPCVYDQLASGIPSSKPPSIRSKRSTVLRVHAPGMEDESGALVTMRLSHESGVKVARLVGEPGYGKTTLLRKFLASAKSSGDVVLEVGRDPWWARPSGYTLRLLIDGLLRADHEGDVEAKSAPPSAQRGVQEILSKPVEGRKPAPDEYARVVATGLRWAVERAASGALTGRVVIGIDDFDRIDGVSRHAITELLANPPAALLMLVVTHGPQFRPGWEHRSEARLLRGVPVANAVDLVRSVGRQAASEMERLSVQTVAPLFVEQLVRHLAEGGHQAPTSMGDLLTARLEALPVDARLVLQAMAALGDEVALEDLQLVLPDRCEFERALASVAAAGMIDRGAMGFRWAHPLLREIAAASTPMAARKDLYAKAYDIADSRGLPLEVRAMMAFEAELDMEAMFLLDQSAERASQRGDDTGAIEALQLGLQAARREALRGDQEEASSSILMFGRKLGDALLRTGQLAEADRLLREMLELAGPESPDGVHILRGIARLGRAEARSGEACSVLPPARRSREA